MPFITVAWWVIVVYWVGFAITWRTLTGHMAWSIHRSASSQKTLRPPVENWIWCAVPCAVLACIWPAVLLFAFKWPYPRGVEKEAEAMLAKVDEETRKAELDRITLENEHRADHLLGTVMDD